MKAALHLVKPERTEQQDVDEYGELQRQIDLMDPVVKRHKVLEAKLKARLAGTTPGEEVGTLTGNLYTVRPGPAAVERTITDKKKVFSILKKRLGLDGLIALITIPLGEGVDKHLTKSEQTTVLVEERSGRRSMDVVALAPASTGPSAA